MHYPRYLPILAVLVACSSRKAETPHSFRIYREHGVTIAETTGGPKYKEELFNYELKLTLQEDERVESVLVRPSQFLTDESGRYYVMDNRASRIAVFDPQGRYSHDIGRPGAGPGELRSGNIQSLKDGIVSVYDGGHRRMSRFQIDGTLVDITTMPAGQRISATRYQHFGEDRMMLWNIETTRFNSHTSKVTLAVIQASGDTVWSYETEPCEVGHIAEMDLGGATVRNPLPYPFGPTPSIDFLDGLGFLINDGLEQALTFLNLDGAVVKRIRVEIQPVPITAKDKEIVKANGDRIMAGRSESSREFIRQQQINMKYLDNKAPWQSARFDDAGFIWLAVPENSEQREAGGGGTLYRVLSSEGEYLGLSRLPNGTSKILGGRLLMIESDPETDEYSLKVYEMKPAPSEFRYPG